MTQTAITHGHLIDINRQLLDVPKLPDEARGERLRELHEQATSWMLQCKNLLTTIEAAAFEHISATHEDIPLGPDRRWTIGKDKKTRSLDDTAILHAILEATQGDVGRLTTGPDGVLGSQPWKPATVKSIIGTEAFERLFKTTYDETLKLKVIDDTHLRAFRG